VSGDGCWQRAAGERWPDHPGGAGQTEFGLLHWGPVGPDLLEEQTLFARFAWCFHTAGHAWALWRRGAVLGPVGRHSLRTPRGTGREAVVEVEADAVLVEALATEYARDLHRQADFGIRVCDVDWEAVGDNIEAFPAPPAGRGVACRRHGLGARRHLSEVYRFGALGERALADWDGIVALADALGHGGVLEADEVHDMLAEKW